MGIGLHEAEWSLVKVADNIYGYKIFIHRVILASKNSLFRCNYINDNYMLTL